MLPTLPPETLLSILAYLDLPDLASLSTAIPSLAPLTHDPLLHRLRLTRTTPSRVGWSLFAGEACRPTRDDLVRRGTMRGLGLQGRIERGLYIGSYQAVQQYEASERLNKRLIRMRLTRFLLTRSHPHHLSSVLPAPEHIYIDRSLLPTVRALKWCLRRDEVARMTRGWRSAGVGGVRGMGRWFEGRKEWVQVDERVVRAVCPGVRGLVRFYEELAGESVGPENMKITAT